MICTKNHQEKTFKYYFIMGNEQSFWTAAAYCGLDRSKQTLGILSIEFKIQGNLGDDPTSVRHRITILQLVFYP